MKDLVTSTTWLFDVHFRTAAGIGFLFLPPAPKQGVSSLIVWNDFLCHFLNLLLLFASVQTMHHKADIFCS